MKATIQDIKDAQKVIGSINECISDGVPPTPEKVELCEQYITSLVDIGLSASSVAVEDALNCWCELLLDA